MVANELVCFRCCFREKLLQNNQSLWNFRFWGYKKAVLLLKNGTNFLFYVEKSCDYADVDVNKLGGFVSLHPVRCPVKRRKDISHNRNCNLLRPNGCMQD